MNVLKNLSYLLFLCLSFNVNAQDMPLKMPDTVLHALDSIDKPKVKFGSDYIITVKGDTFRCVITTIPLIGAIIYHIKDSSGLHSMKISEVRQYYRAKKAETYVAVKPPTCFCGLFHSFDSARSAITYMKLLEKGRLNLYELITVLNSGYSVTTRKVWYASEDGVLLFEIKNNFWASDSADIKAFSKLISNDAAVSNLLNCQKSFSFRNIRYLIQRYNSDIQ